MLALPSAVADDHSVHTLSQLGAKLADVLMQSAYTELRDRSTVQSFRCAGFRRGNADASLFAPYLTAHMYWMQ